MIGVMRISLWYPIVLAGCGGSYSHLTATLGGETAGDRGTVRVLFINNTPYRAVLTVGTYDDLDRFSEPDFRQFGSKDREQNLDGDSSSGFLGLDCGRILSVGGERLLNLIDRNLPDADLIEEAKAVGVLFYRLPEDGGESDDEPVLEGTAPAIEALIGADFNCGAIVVLYLEFDDSMANSFRVDFRVIPSDPEP